MHFKNQQSQMTKQNRIRNLNLKLSKTRELIYQNRFQLEQ